MGCDLCGRDCALVRAKIEGVILNVCDSCSRHGKVLEAPKVEIKKYNPSFDVKHGLPKFEEVVVENFSKVVKEARERKGWEQKELSQKIAERESLISKIETGVMVPDLKTAKKLQHALGVRIVERVEI